MAQYRKISMTGTYFKLLGWFFMFMPVFVPYEQIYPKAEQAGLKPIANSNKGMLEKGVSFGQGWIAIEIEATDKADSRIFTLEGEFDSVEHIGPYKELGNVYQQIMKDYPQAKDFYSMYLNSPKEVAPSELKTVVAFR